MKFAIATLVLMFSLPSFALRVVGSEIMVNPSGVDNSEYGVVYSNTGLLPARLQLYCQGFIDEASWDGTMPAEGRQPCGSLDLKIRLSSFGFSLFYINEHLPFTFQIHGNPRDLPLRSVIGSFSGGKAGIGLTAGVRTLVLKNRDSGVWLTGGQIVESTDVGIDLSVPNLEVYLVNPADLKRPLSSFADLTST